MNAEDIYNEFKQHFTQLLQANHIHNETLVVALSGGLDSIVLLYLLHRYQQNNDAFQLTAHHVNHGLSEHAEQWAIFCRDYCQSLHIPFIMTKVDLKKSSRTSLEALAREARYRAFEHHMQGTEVVLTAHHQDDQFETLLLALKRGSGPTGLQGVRTYQPFANGGLLRPLLCFSRAQLQAYATLNNLEWVEDESNRDTTFDRNFIRQEISPRLKQRWPNIDTAVARTAQICQEQQNLLDEVAQQDYRHCELNRLSQSLLDITSVAKLSAARRNNLLRFWLKRHHIPYPSQKQLLVLWHEVAFADPDKQPKLLLKDHSIRRYAGALYIVSEQHVRLPTEPILWNGEAMLTLVEGEISVDFSKVDQSLAKGYTIECCFREHLDPQLSCLPKQREKARSVKKLLHEFQVPPWLREYVVFVFCNNQLLQAVDVWQCVADGFPTLDLTVHSRR